VPFLASWGTIIQAHGFELVCIIFFGNTNVTITLNDQKEEFSIAYVNAVASVAGCSTTRATRLVDNGGIDITIRNSNVLGKLTHPSLDIQLKCTSSDNIEQANQIIKHPIPIGNYNTLIGESCNPIILVLVIVPDDIKEWIDIDHEKTVMKRCGYWVSLRGSQPTSNSSNITISIPSSNIFDQFSLDSIMRKIANGDMT
jgi:hypothetical protein